MARDLFEEAGVMPSAAGTGPRDLFAEAGIQQPGAATGADTTSRTDRVLRGMRDPIAGGAQLLTKALPEGVVRAGNSLNNWLADNTGMVARLPAGGVDQLEREQEAAYQAARGADSGSFDGYRVAGNVISPANVAIAARAPAAASLLGRVGVGAGTGAASAALNPVASGNPADFWTEKGKQVGTGAAFGGALPMVTSALGRAINPNAANNPQLALLRQEGVKPTIGQSLGGAWNKAEEKLSSLPIVGDGISAARGRAQEQFNQAAINRALAPIGKTTREVGQDGIAGAQRAVGDAYDAASSAMGNFRLDRQAVSDLRTVQSMAQNLDDTGRKQFERIWGTVANDITPTGSILEGSFKKIDSKLGKEAARFAGSPDVYQQQLGDALGEMRGAIRSSALRANPKAAELTSQADKAYANLVRVEGAAKAALANGGVFTPGQLNSAVRMADQSVRDRATAGGKALMQDLSSAGQSVLGNKVPNSGTADRLLGSIGGLGVGSGFGLVNPAVPAALAAGWGLYTQPVQSLLRSAVASRPQQAQAVRDALLKASPRLLPAASQVGIGLLDYQGP